MLVTLTFVLACTGAGTRLLETRGRRLPRARDQAFALPVFLLMALIEEAVGEQNTPMNAGVIAACAAGLLAGPWVGAATGAGAVATAALFRHGAFGPGVSLEFALTMPLTGLLAGWLRGARPTRSLDPRAAFFAGAGASLLRYAVAGAFCRLFNGPPPLPSAPLPIFLTIAVNGLGVALVLLVARQIRAQRDNARAVAQAEVRALQARMNPHFLFNALNTVAALSAVNSSAVPGAVGQLGRFLRASLDQHDRALVPLRDELDVTRAYLDIEALRLGERLRVEEAVDAAVLDAAVPPFVLQPLVENAVCHGLQPGETGGRIRVTACANASWLVLEVSDTGTGMTHEQCARATGTQTNNGSDGGAHALTLLRCRLHALYDGAAVLTIESRLGEGTTVTVRLPTAYGQDRP